MRFQLNILFFFCAKFATLYSCVLQIFHFMWHIGKKWMRLLTAKSNQRRIGNQPRSWGNQYLGFPVTHTQQNMCVSPEIFSALMEWNHVSVWTADFSIHLSKESSSTQKLVYILGQYSWMVSPSRNFTHKLPELRKYSIKCGTRILARDS